MGTWGHKPFQNDSDLDWRGDFNDPIIARLKNAIRQTEYRTETRAAIEYLIRLDKGGLYLLTPRDPIFDLSLKRATEIAEEFSDPDSYSWWARTSDKEKAEAVKENVESVREQIRYLKMKARKYKQREEKRKSSPAAAELDEAFEELKGKVKKRKKSKGKR